MLFYGNRIVFDEENKTKIGRELLLLPIRRDEATRTPDPYVPNVVRYQLRYFPIATAKIV